MGNAYTTTAIGGPLSDPDTYEAPKPPGQPASGDTITVVPGAMLTVDANHTLSGGGWISVGSGANVFEVSTGKKLTIGSGGALEVLLGALLSCDGEIELQAGGAMSIDNGYMALFGGLFRQTGGALSVGSYAEFRGNVNVTGGTWSIDSNASMYLAGTVAIHLDSGTAGALADESGGLTFSGDCEFYCMYLTATNRIRYTGASVFYCPVVGGPHDIEGAGCKLGGGSILAGTIRAFRDLTFESGGVMLSGSSIKLMRREVRLLDQSGEVMADASQAYGFRGIAQVG